MPFAAYRAQMLIACPVVIDDFTSAGMFIQPNLSAPLTPTSSRQCRE